MKITVSARESQHTFDCGDGEKILHAGLRHGIALPYECGTGTCGTCKAVLAGGEVNDGWPAAPAHKYLKAERNEFLMCQCSARSDCTLELRGRIAPMVLPQPGHHAGVIAAAQDLNAAVVRLEVLLDAAVEFEAGQFMLVDVDGLEGRRGLSMANFDRPAERIVFTVKLMPEGGLSQWLRAGAGTSDRVGTRVRLFGPLGKAVYRPGDGGNLLFIAGGSGLAPMLSILSRAHAERQFDARRGHIFFGVRTAEDLYAMEELVAHKKAFPGNFSLTVALSDEEPGPDLSRQWPDVSFATGLVHEVAGRAMAGKYDDTTAYLAGPPPMVESAMRMLMTEARLPPSRIRFDKFS
jgi:toluene monooxygenase electron transfer component